MHDVEAGAATSKDGIVDCDHDIDDPEPPLASRAMDDDAQPKCKRGGATKQHKSKRKESRRYNRLDGKEATGGDDDASIASTQGVPKATRTTIPIGCCCCLGALLVVVPLSIDHVLNAMSSPFAAPQPSPPLLSPAPPALPPLPEHPFSSTPPPPRPVAPPPVAPPLPYPPPSPPDCGALESRTMIPAWRCKAHFDNCTSFYFFVKNGQGPPGAVHLCTINYDDGSCVASADVMQCRNAPPAVPSPPVFPPPWHSIFANDGGRAGWSDAEVINARFHRKPYHANWQARGDLADAGVMIHIFDDYELKWDRDRNQQVYYKTNWKYDREISSSLIFADQRPECCPEARIAVYHGSYHGVQGIVYRPGFSTRVLCGWAQDRSSRGCGAYGWCPSPTKLGFLDPNEMDGCTAGFDWRPEDFGAYLEKSTPFQRSYQRGSNHNEFSIDGEHWNRHLPDVVEAFFGDGPLAREQHRLFLTEYNLTSEQVPLLQLNLHDWESPFGV